MAFIVIFNIVLGNMAVPLPTYRPGKGFGVSHYPLFKFFSVSLTQKKKKINNAQRTSDGWEICSRLFLRRKKNLNMSNFIFVLVWFMSISLFSNSSLWRLGGACAPSSPQQGPSLKTRRVSGTKPEQTQDPALWWRCLSSTFHTLVHHLYQSLWKCTEQQEKANMHARSGDLSICALFKQHRPLRASVVTC